MTLPAESDTEAHVSTTAGEYTDARDHRGLDDLLEVRGESKTLGRYVVMGTLGRGGMGVVLRGFDPKLDRRVAIKVLHRELSEQQTQRLLREAQALARLSHPNVVQVYEVDEIDGQTFVVMELVQGQTIAQWCEAEPRPDWRRCVEVMIQAGEGLAAAHEQGLVHRDFKPGNAIVDERGRARVLDFGLARAVGVEVDSIEVPPAGVDMEAMNSDVLSDRLTRTGAMLGTPAYMPPEQMHGRDVDARSDQFSFCVSLYEAVHGERPFAGETMMEVIGSIVQGTVRPPPPGIRVPRGLRRILLRGLLPEPEQRWPSMNALLVELRRLLAPRRWRWAGGSVGVGLAVLGAGLWYQAEAGQRCSGAAEQLRGIWDEGRRADVRGSILGTELPYASSTWTRVEETLDGYAGAWAEQYAEACEATAVRKEQSEEDMSLRMGCLRERKRELEAAVKVLATSDEQVVLNAVTIVDGLQDLARCEDVQRLRQRRERVPPPEDPERAREAEELADVLVDVQAERLAGRGIGALERVVSVVERAEALEYDPLLANALYMWAGILDEQGKPAEAEKRLIRSYALALESGYDEASFIAARSLTDVVGHRQTRFGEGRVWAQTAMSLAKRSGSRWALAGSTHAMGMLLFTEARFEEAEREFLRALELWDAKRWPLDIADSFDGLGGVYFRQGRYGEAEQGFRRALELREETLGSEHPKVAVAMNNLGNVLDRQGRSEEAERQHRRAMEIRVRALGEEHPLVAGSMNNLGAVLNARGQNEEAERWFRRALEIKRKAVGADGLELTSGMNNLGNVLQKQGEFEEAEQWYRRALEIKQRVLGPEHVSLGFSLVGLARVLVAQGEHERAVGPAERAVVLREASGEAPELLAEARYWLARALGPDPTERARARELAQRARTGFVESTNPQVQADIADIDRWLAELPDP